MFPRLVQNQKKKQRGLKKKLILYIYCILVLPSTSIIFQTSSSSSQCLQTKHANLSMLVAVCSTASNSARSLLFMVSRNLTHIRWPMSLVYISFGNPSHGLCMYVYIYMVDWWASKFLFSFPRCSSGRSFHFWIEIKLFYKREFRKHLHQTIKAPIWGELR